MTKPSQTSLLTSQEHVELSEARAIASERRASVLQARLETTSVKLSVATATAEAKAARALAAEAHLAAMVASSSWRITRPLRSIIYRTRKLLSYLRVPVIWSFLTKFLGRAIARPVALVAEPPKPPETVKAFGWHLDHTALMTLRVEQALAHSLTELAEPNISQRLLQA